MDETKKRYLLNQFIGFLKSGEYWETLDPTINLKWNSEQDKEVREEIAKILSERLKETSDNVY